MKYNILGFTKDDRLLLQDENELYYFDIFNEKLTKVELAISPDSSINYINGYILITKNTSEMSYFEIYDVDTFNLGNHSVPTPTGE